MLLRMKNFFQTINKSESINYRQQRSHQNVDASAHEKIFLTINKSESINQRQQRSHQNVDASAHEKFFLTINNSESINHHQLLGKKILPIKKSTFSFLV